MFLKKKAKAQHGLTNLEKRSHFYGGSKTYASGFEKMVLDKFHHMPILSKLPWFSLFGLANVFCYGLSHLMSEKDYLYYFSYKGNGRLSDLARSNFGSNSLVNVAWTAPLLIVGGSLIHSKLGALNSLKFTALSLVCIGGFQTAFGPNQDSAIIPNFRPIYGMGIPKFCAHGPGYSMGADQLASATAYLALMYFKMWYPVLGFIAFDFAYYGPQGMGGCAAGFLGGLALL